MRMKQDYYQPTTVRGDYHEIYKNNHQLLLIEKVNPVDFKKNINCGTY